MDVFLVYFEIMYSVPTNKASRDTICWHVYNNSHHRCRDIEDEIHALSGHQTQNKVTTIPQKPEV